MIKKIKLFLAERGFFKHEGLFLYQRHRYPLGRVNYPDGLRSARMPLGNAVEYAKIFGGTVEVL